MKQVGRILAAIAALALLSGSATAAPKKAKPKLETFIVETSHNEAECLAAMDEVMATVPAAKKGKTQKTPPMLEKTQWGCLSGDHRGWTTVKAKDQEDALKILPESMRASAKVVQVTTITVKQIKDIHKKMEKEKAAAEAGS